MFTYISLGTNDLERAAHFYDAVLEPLGLKRCDTSGEPNWQDWVGWGRYEQGGAQELALWLCKPYNGAPATPGLRPHYNDDFYAAYVRDPDGNKLAAVCRRI